MAAARQRPAPVPQLPIQSLGCPEGKSVMRQVLIGAALAAGFLIWFFGFALEMGAI